MKFGKRLLTLAVPEWRQKYVEYKQLKKVIKRVRRGEAHQSVNATYNSVESTASLDTTATTRTAELGNQQEEAEDVKKQSSDNDCEFYFKEFSRTQEWAYKRVPNVASPFVFCLMSELDKVNEFFERTERRYATRQAQIQQQLESYRKLRARRGKQGLGKKHLTKLKRVIQEHYRALNLLLNYRILNYTAFIKIIKKFEKRMMYSAQPEKYSGILNEFTRHLHRQYFYASPILKALIVQMEYIFAEDIHQGDRKKAMIKLRKKEKSKRASAVESFLTGIFGGIALLLTAIAIYYYFMEFPNPHYRVKKPAPEYTSTTFFLYRLILLPIIMGMLFSLDVVIWKAKRINYVFIFQFNPRDHLYPWQLAELFFAIYDISMISLLAFMWTVVMETRGIINFHGYAYLHPFILMAILGGWLLNPLKLRYGKARWWLIKVLLRIFCAPFVQVKFADFFIADQLTSLSSVLFELQFVVCVYPTLYVNNVAKFCDRVQGLGIPILNVVPAYCRFMQCIRRFIDSRQWNPHLLNAGKYASSILVAIFTFIDRGVFNTSPTSQNWNAFRILYLITAVYYTVYAVAWDLYFDWGLLRWQFKLLRKEKLFNPIVYYIAMFADIVLRSFWLATFLLKYFFPTKLVDPWIPFAFVLVELCRRGMWNIFRLENEHLNNCGQFRAVTDIPLPFEVELQKVAQISENGSEEPKFSWKKPWLCCPRLFPTKLLGKWRSQLAIFDDDPSADEDNDGTTTNNRTSTATSMTPVHASAKITANSKQTKRTGSFALDLQLRDLKSDEEGDDLDTLEFSPRPHVAIPMTQSFGRSNSAPIPLRATPILLNPNLRHLTPDNTTPKSSKSGE